jgi:hypothetical protein
MDMTLPTFNLLATISHHAYRFLLHSAPDYEKNQTTRGENQPAQLHLEGESKSSITPAITADRARIGHRAMAGADRVCVRDDGYGHARRVLL